MDFLTKFVNAEWLDLMQRANQDNAFLTAPEVVRQLDYLLKINQKLALSAQQAYSYYLQRIFEDLINIYRVYTMKLQQTNSQDKVAKQMRQARRDILKLIQLNINATQDFATFNQEFLPTLQGLVVDFQESHPDSRDPEVLFLFATIMRAEGANLEGFVDQILYNLCYKTLEMIFNDFQSYPDFREGLFTLVRDIIKHCTVGLFKLEAARFDNMVKSINFAIKHTKPEICDLGLEAMYSLLTLVADADPNTRNQFFAAYFVLIFDETLFVMTEQTYIAGFHEQSQILNVLFRVLDYVTIPIQDENQQPAQTDNKSFLGNRLNRMLQDKFTNMNSVQIETFVLTLFNKAEQFEQFKDTLRDFLIQMKQMSSTDEYYVEERKAAQQEQESLKAQKAQTVPGLASVSQTF